MYRLRLFLSVLLLALSFSAMPTPSLVSISKAAQELGTSVRFVRRRIADGTLPAIRLKGSSVIRIDRRDLEAMKQPVNGAS